MNTRRGCSSGLQCDQCIFRTNTIDDELQLRNHFRYNHSELKFHIKNFRSEQKNINNKSTTVSVKTLQKRKRTARKSGCKNENPRQCYCINRSGKRCLNWVISQAETALSVRCTHHPLRDIVFAKSRGIFGEPLSYVTVRPSTVLGGGNGVFTTGLGSFNEGDFITEYVGVLLSEAQFTANQHNPEHTLYCATFSLPYLSGINEIVIGKGVGSFINRRDKENPANTKFVYRFAKTKAESVWIVAVKKIEMHEELFVPYGNSFSLLHS
jgi:hypothetical protein